MPILKDFRECKTITLPRFPDSKLEIYDSILVGKMSVIDFKSENQLEQIMQSLPLFIKSWNFTDEEGKDLEINQDNIGFLNIDDLKYISEQIMQFSEEVKKKQSNSQC